MTSIYSIERKMDILNREMDTLKREIQHMISEYNHSLASMKKECDEKKEKLDQKIDLLKNKEVFVNKIMKKHNNKWIMDSIEEPLVRQIVSCILEELDNDE
jgi:uridine kinase